MVFSLLKVFLSDEGIMSVERYNEPGRAKFGTNDVTLLYKLRHFQTPEKQKNGKFINVIYKLMYL